MAWERRKSKLPTRSEAAVGEFERYECVEHASGWEGFQLEYRECGFSAIPCDRSFKRPYSISDPGLTAYLESTPLELSNDAKFVEILLTL